MRLVRKLVLSFLHYNILFRCVHVKGHDYTLADALSRLQVQKIVSIDLPSADACPDTTGPGTLPATLKKLMTACLAPSTRRAYDKVWLDFDNFCTSVLQTPAHLPINYATLALYVAHCHEKGLSPSTITSHLSAIAYVHNLAGHADPTKTFFIRKLLTCASKLNPTYDVRLPITEPVLHKLVTSLNFICPDRYDQLLYRSIFCLVFYGLARIGELVITSRQGVKNVLHIENLHIRYHNENPSSIEIKFSNSNITLTMQYIRSQWLVSIRIP